MKKFILVLIFAVTTGCAPLTYHGTYIAPLPAGVVVGTPVVVAAPIGVVVLPLPAVYVIPGRNAYYYNKTYYYHYGPDWYWSLEAKGPWHKLSRKSWPPALKLVDKNGNELHSSGGHHFDD